MNRSALSNISEFHTSIEQEVKNLTEAMEKGDREVITETEDSITYSIEHGKIRVDGTIVFDNILLGLSVLLVIVMGIIVYRSIVKPVKSASTQLDEIVEKIEQNQGDLTSRIQIKSKDEVGRLVVGMNSFIEQLQMLMQKIQSESRKMMQSADAVTKSVGESNQGAMNVSAISQELAANMEEVSTTLDQISRGSNSVLGRVQEMQDSVFSETENVEQIKQRAQKMNYETVENKNSCFIFKTGQ